ncbi:MAG: hypothetical protein WC932_05580 [archaeon]|jgi:hypothetical protein
MKIVKKNKTYFLNFKDDNESNDLDNYTDKELEIKIIADNVVSFIIKDKYSSNLGQTKPSSSLTQSKENIKQKIISILQDKDLPFKEKVEGAFEELLKPADLLVFKEMLKNKEIITYKQSDKYKKAIYVPNEEKQITIARELMTTGGSQDPKKSREDLLSASKTGSEKEVEVLKSTEVKSKVVEKENSEEIIKGFLKKKYGILKAAETADKFSREFYTKFKNNEIKGQKSFDGYFYVVDKYIYESTVKQIMSSGMIKSFSIEELGTKLNKEIELLKVVIEFLKEEGVIIEKKRNVYCLI